MTDSKGSDANSAHDAAVVNTNADTSAASGKTRGRRTSKKATDDSESAVKSTAKTTSAATHSRKSTKTASTASDEDTQDTASAQKTRKSTKTASTARTRRSTKKNAQTEASEQPRPSTEIDNETPPAIQESSASSSDTSTTESSAKKSAPRAKRATVGRPRKTEAEAKPKSPRGRKKTQTPTVEALEAAGPEDAAAQPAAAALSSDAASATTEASTAAKTGKVQRTSAKSTRTGTRGRKKASSAPTTEDVIDPSTKTTEAAAPESEASAVSGEHAALAVGALSSDGRVDATDTADANDMADAQADNAAQPYEGTDAAAIEDVTAFAESADPPAPADFPTSFDGAAFGDPFAVHAPEQDAVTAAAGEDDEEQGSTPGGGKDGENTEKKRRGRSRRGGRGRRKTAAHNAAHAEGASARNDEPAPFDASPDPFAAMWLEETPPQAEESPDAATPRERDGGERPSQPRRDESASKRDAGKKHATQPRALAVVDAADDNIYDLDIDDEEDTPKASMAKTGKRKMFVSVLPEEQVEVVITEEGQVQEYYVEMLHQAKIKGNIYKGTIHNVDPNLQAAFVSYGAVKNGFLQIDEVHPEYYVAPHEAGKGRKYPPIQKVLKPGQEVLVQVVKEPAGTKGAFLTTYLSLPGRFLVLTPGREQIGVSRKVENEGERSRLRELLEGLNPGPGLGVIVRTVSMGASKTSLQRDLQFLKRTWKEVRSRGTSEKAPCLIYQEMDLTSRAVRDYLTDAVMEVWIDDDATAESVTEIAEALFPRKNNLVRVHQDLTTTLFERFNLQRQLDQIHSREVALPSGGRLVIDPTEALTAIDINSGRSGGKNNFEDMAFRTNMEAARMIPLQLRLRDIGGQVVADFIEMRDKSHWREVEKTLRAGMKADRARYDVGKIGPFGMLEIVRQRLGSSAISISTEPCPCCNGTGVRRNMEWRSQHALREIQRALRSAQAQEQTVVFYPADQALALHLLNNKRQRLLEMERAYSVRLELQIKLQEIL